jgi:hypothetical protein
MWTSRSSRDGLHVTCIACGESVPRSDAREYDKHGDRWDREGKNFEYLCKVCYRDLCHQPRDDLESMLVESDAGAGDQDAFLATYFSLIEERSESIDEP